MVTYVNKDRDMMTQTLEWFVLHGNTEVIDRLRYVRDVMQLMIKKRQARNA